MLTFDSLLTAPGIGAAAVAITTAVQVLKAGIPWLDLNVSGASMAFVLSAVLYAVAALVLPNPSPDQYLAIASAWLLAAGAAMGVKAAADHLDAVRTGTAGLSPAIAPASHGDVPGPDVVEVPPVPDPAADPVPADQPLEDPLPAS